MSFLRFYVDLLDKVFQTSHPKLTGWTHVVLNYIGPNDGEGIRLYQNGQEVRSYIARIWLSSSAGDGRIVVGKDYTHSDGNYASVQVDELIYFNTALTDTQVQSIYNSA